MLKIRNDQIAALEQRQAGTIVRQLALALRADRPAETRALSDDELIRLAEDGYRKARGHGLQRRADVAMFLELMLTAPDFDAYPPVRFILTHPDIAGDDKVGTIVERMREADWDDARERARRSKGQSGHV